MRTVVAIDPGEKYCGVAWFVDGGRNWERQPTATLAPTELFGWLEGFKLQIEVVYEEYKLYPWLLQQQGFSAVETAETIGVIKRICYKAGWRCTAQSATIKKPATGWMEHKKLAFQGRNQHERDAEMHGLHYILKENWDAW